MTVTTVTIGGNPYNVYGDETEADLFMAADIELAAGWTALTGDQKPQGLVSATRLIDRQDWLGAIAVDGQPLEWPRTGLTDKNGTEVVSASLPQFVENACIILAAMLAAKSTLQASASTGSNVKRVKAGPAEVEFFNSTLTSGAIFPARVQDLLGLFLDNQAVTGMCAAGTGSLTSGEDYSLSKGYA